MAGITERLRVPGSGQDPFTTGASPPSEGLCPVPVSEENLVAQGPEMGNGWAVSWLHTGSLTPGGEHQPHADPCPVKGPCSGPRAVSRAAGTTSAAPPSPANIRHQLCVLGAGCSGEARGGVGALMAGSWAVKRPQGRGGCSIGRGGVLQEQLDPGAAAKQGSDGCVEVFRWEKHSEGDVSVCKTVAPVSCVDAKCTEGWRGRMCIPKGPCTRRGR